MLHLLDDQGASPQHVVVAVRGSRLFLYKFELNQTSKPEF